MLNLDTHMVVALLRGDLTPVEDRLLARQKLAMSDIVLWELSKLVQTGRLEMEMESDEFHRFLRSVTVFPITLEIARTSTRLDFTSDPADEIIAATSIVQSVPLLTRDRRILKSRLVPFAR